MPKTSAKRKTTQVPEHLQTHPSDRAIARADADAASSSRSTKTVLVGCKIANGLKLELVEPGTVCGPDGKPVQRRNPAPAGKFVILKGPNSLRTDRRAAQAEHPFAITEVDEAFWNAWFERHKDREFVTGGFIFVVERDQSDNAMRDAQAIARERHALRTGLEPLASKDDPRLKPSIKKPEFTVEVDPSSMPEGRERQEPVAVA